MERKAVDLFCGCGGLSLGLKKAGFNVVAGLDSWKEALTVYQANNLNHDSVLHDVGNVDKTVEVVEKYKPFVIAGGPPCQDFSIAGNRSEGSRAALTVRFAEVIERVGPSAFIMENVPRARNSKAFSDALQVFRRAGYGMTMIVLNAALCGVPQARKRLFLIGLKGEEDDFLLPLLKENMSSKPMSIRDYAPDLVGFDFYYRHPRTYARRAIYSIDEPSPTIRGVNRPKPSTYKMHNGDGHTPDNDLVQCLDLNQRAILQTFPDGYFDAEISKANKEQMIGNAIPVELARFVASNLSTYVDQRTGHNKKLSLMDKSQDIAEKIAKRSKEMFIRAGVDEDINVEDIDPNFSRDIYRILARLEDVKASNSEVMSFVEDSEKKKAKKEASDLLAASSGVES